MKKIGIDAIAYSLPQHQLPISALAEARGIAYAKLNVGLGLESMAVCSPEESVDVLAAEAVVKLIEQNNINPKDIGKIYMGTESALDGAKPTMTYALNHVERMLGIADKSVFRNTDVIDMTFACIAAFDAMMLCVDWIRSAPGAGREAIVVGADIAKYDLGSSGEYTQGAGAVAVLLKEDPRIMVLGDTVGVGMKSEVDFHKPLRAFNKLQALKDAAGLLGVTMSDKDLLAKIAEAEAHRAESIALNPTQMNVDADQTLWSIPGNVLKVSRTEPVFDGYFSNECYRARLEEAIAHYQAQVSGWSVDAWKAWIFHQPYAFQGRRMAVRFWMDAILRPMVESGDVSDFEAMGLSALSGLNWQEVLSNPELEKSIAKSAAYKSFVAEVIAPGERASAQLGNLYTGSVLMSLLSVLADAHERGLDLGGQKAGFFAYGSGSKGKVVEGVFVSGCETSQSATLLFGDLMSRQSIDFDTYVRWHA
jgi:hydroxymethylglutaryl-CoA synthase